MNAVLKTIEARYSCRSFTPQLPEEGLLSAVAKAAVQSPSGMNRQAWRVIMVTDRSLLEEMEAEALSCLRAMPDPTLYTRVMERGGTIFYHAPAMMMIPIDPAQAPGSVMDCGIVCQTAALAAASLGMDSLICGMARLVFSGEKAGYFMERLGFPSGYEFGVAVLLGYGTASGTPHDPDLNKISWRT